MRMSTTNKILFVCIVAIVLTLVIAVAAGPPSPQHPHPALAILVGVVCGIAAGVPTSLLLLVILTTRQSQPLQAPPRNDLHPGGGPDERHYPAVIVWNHNGAASNDLGGLLLETGDRKLLS